MEKPQNRRGIRQVVMAVVAAALVISPSFLAKILISHSKLDISTIAIVSLAIFLVGAYLIVTLLKE